MKNKEEIPEYMYPKNDFIFKRLFGYEGNEDITKDLVSNIIGEKIKSLEFKNPNLIREVMEDKEEILDIKAVLDNNVLCDIEIQVVNHHDIEKRVLNYWAKMYRQSIGKSKKYINMKRTIVIFITTFDIDRLKDIEEYKTRWRILEEKLKIELTDVFELDIIELSKAKRQLEAGALKETERLKDWIKFLINPQDMEESKMKEMSEELKKAYELWQSLNANEAERDAAERRFMDLASFEYAKEYEHNLGKKEKAIEIAKKMKKKDLPIELIMEMTELSKEEIEKL